MPSEYNFSWSDLAFRSKKPISNLNATFIVAPREMSAKRFIQLVKEYLPKGNIVLGLANEPFIDGFDGQPQFKTLQKSAVEQIINKTNASATVNKIYTLTYFQRELNYILEKLKFARVVLVNGSWQKSFHTLAPFYTLINSQTPFEYVSPFASEQEAIEFANKYTNNALKIDSKLVYSPEQMLGLAKDVAKQSFETAFQVGAVLGAAAKGGYKYLTSAYNRVVPYETYAWQHGASREKHFSPTYDQNYYDAVHAETCILINAVADQISLDSTSLFINVLPCPSCARMFAATPIKEFYYQIDHSDGYAVKMLELAGKKVIRKV